MYGLTRGTITLLGAAGAGLLVWLATQIDDGSNGGYWAVYGLIAAAGLVMAFSQILGGWTKWGWPRLSLNVFLLAFVPVLVAAGWVVIAHQPTRTGSARTSSTGRATSASSASSETWPSTSPSWRSAWGSCSASRSTRPARPRTARSAGAGAQRRFPPAVRLLPDGGPADRARGARGGPREDEVDREREPARTE